MENANNAKEPGTAYAQFAKEAEIAGTATVLDSVLEAMITERAAAVPEPAFVPIAMEKATRIENVIDAVAQEPVRPVKGRRNAILAAETEMPHNSRL